MLKISIIIPVYNAEKYLDECILSVLNSDYKNIEVILIDDASTDKSTDIIKKYASNDKRVKYIRNQKNLGAGICRNIGITHSKGELTAFLDCDDYFTKDFLPKMIEAYQRNKSDIVICCYYTLYDNKMKEYHHKFNYGFEPAEIISKDTIPKYIFNVFSFAIWNRVYNTKFLKENNLQFEEVKYANDLYFNKLSLYKANNITFLNECLVVHRTNVKNSLTKNYTYKNYDIIERHRYQIETFKNLNLSDEMMQSLINAHLEEQYELQFFEFTKSKESFIEVYSKIRKYIKFYPPNYIYNQDIQRFMFRLKLLPATLIWNIRQFNYRKGLFKNKIKKLFLKPHS